MMSSSHSASSLLHENSRENCKNISYECLTSRSSGECTEIWNEWGDDSSEEGKKEEKRKSLREIILEEFKREWEDLEDWEKEKQEEEEEEEDLRFEKSLREDVEYLKNEIFPILLPGITKMLEEAEKWDVLEVQKCRFNGLDCLAEYLWNKNPRHSERQFAWKGIYEIPPFRKWLQTNPRPIYPKSWLWSKEEAALIIQRNVRGWIVRKRIDVQELREFWKALAEERAERDSSLSSIDLDEFDDFRQKNQEIDTCKILK